MKSSESLVKEAAKDHAERRKQYKKVKDVRRYLDQQEKQREIEMQKRKEMEKEKVSIEGGYDFTKFTF